MRTTLATAVLCVSFSVLALTGCGAVESGACTVGSSEGCGANAACVDEGGIATCRCNAGFTGDGQSCSDVDECAAGTDTCAAVATCSNNAGASTCACPGGYSGDGTTGGTGCADVNECATNPCDAQATCNNVPGTFQCGCNSGYTGNGITCMPVDCGALTAPANGNVMTPSGTTFGQTATYGAACNGNQTRAAQMLGMLRRPWSSASPSTACRGRASRDRDHRGTTLTTPGARSAVKRRFRKLDALTC